MYGLFLTFGPGSNYIRQSDFFVSCAFKPIFEHDEKIISLVAWLYYGYTRIQPDRFSGKIIVFGGFAEYRNNRQFQK